jgi:hypothetical protein
MLAAVLKMVREKAISAQDDLAEVLNREIVPVLRQLRDAVNGEIGEESVFNLIGLAHAPTVPGATYGAIDTPVAYVYGFTFSDTDYPETQDGRDRAIYFRVVGNMDAALSTSVSFALYDITAGTEVSGSEFTTDALEPDDSGLLGPLELTSGNDYAVYAKQTDGTATPQAISAEVVIRYE